MAMYCASLLGHGGWMKISIQWTFTHTIRALLLESKRGQHMRRVGIRVEKYGIIWTRSAIGLFLKSLELILHDALKLRTWFHPDIQHLGKLGLGAMHSSNRKCEKERYKVLYLI